MAQARLTTALADGTLSLPDGQVCVMRPGIGYDLSALPDKPLIQHGFRPAWDWWEASGHAMTATLPQVGTAIVVVPRSKAQGRAMIVEAAARAGLVVVDGQRSEGVDSLWRDLRRALGEMPDITKAHGRLMWFAGGADVAARLADWAGSGPQAGPEGFHTQPGVFSDGAVDRGSRLLLSALPAKLPARIADLGAGWGFLSHGILAAHPEVERVDLIEAEALALDCARLNVTDPRAAFHWADATQPGTEGAWDAVVCNPPFHTGPAADPALGRAFIAAAARMLTPQGQLWLVANRHLPYEAALTETFVTVEEAGGDPAFKVLRAARPISVQKAARAVASLPRKRSRGRG